MKRHENPWARFGALVGIAMVLSAVFIPMAFFGGTTGAIYRQFSITIVSAMVLSAARGHDDPHPGTVCCLAETHEEGEEHGKKGFFGWFNRTCSAVTPAVMKPP